MPVNQPVCNVTACSWSHDMTPVLSLQHHVTNVQYCKHIASSRQDGRNACWSISGLGLHHRQSWCGDAININQLVL